jgi:hypothetical protein
MTTPRILLPAAMLVVAVPVAAWGLWGQQDAAGFRPSELDYAYRPPQLPAGLDTGLGIAALVLALVAGAVLVQATRRRRLAADWWGVLVPLMLVGAAVGVGERVLTAGVIGANIGAGLAVFFMGPAIAGLLIWSVARTVRLTTGSARVPHA